MSTTAKTKKTTLSEDLAAENEERLVFHNEWLDLFKDLPEEVQNEAIVAFLYYVLRGEAPTDVRYMAFVKLLGKNVNSAREKYLKICEKNKQLSKRAAAARKAKTSKKISKDEEPENSENPSENSPNSTQIKNKDKNKDKNNSLDFPINQKIEREGKAPSPSEIFDEFFGKDESRTAVSESMAMQLRCTVDELKAAGREIITDWNFAELEHYSRTDALHHFTSALRAKIRKRQESPQGRRLSEIDLNTPGKMGVGEFRDAEGRRTYGTSGIQVPENATPRPSESHYWDADLNQWDNII